MTRSWCGSRPTAVGKWWFALALAAGAAHGDQSVAPYVPTVEEDVELMLDVAGVGPDDYVIDLGSGDGRIVIAAARRGASGHGVELEPALVAEATANARAAGVADRVAFVQGDLFDAEVRAATVVTLYLFPEANIALRPKLLAELAPGTRIVSNSFDMGDWRPDVHDTTARSSGGILLWIVPAHVDGAWDLEIDGDPGETSLSIAQHYQDVTVEAVGPDARLAIRDARLSGDRIAFMAEADGVRYAFNGRVERGTMTGFVQTTRGDETTVGRWRARRAIAAPPLLPPGRPLGITPPSAR